LRKLAPASGADPIFIGVERAMGRVRWQSNPKYPSVSHELHAFFLGKERVLSADAMSQHGLDFGFWYSLMMRPIPTPSQAEALKARLFQLLEMHGPAVMAADLTRGRLVSSLGPQFSWVVIPECVQRGPLARVTGWPSEQPAEQSYVSQLQSEDCEAYEILD
jgi:hypothetical protein